MEKPSASSSSSRASQSASQWTLESLPPRFITGPGTSADIVDLVSAEQKLHAEIEGRLRAEYSRTGASFTEDELAADVEMEKLRIRCFEHRRDLHPTFISGEDPVEHWATIRVPADEEAATTLAHAVSQKQSVALDVLASGKLPASDMILGKSVASEGKGRRAVRR